jgi:SAM-dependent methyltransferase
VNYLTLLARFKAMVSSDQRGTRQNGAIDANVFDRDFYQDITAARLEHFKSLGLSVRGKSVIDIGSGVGHLSKSLAELGGDVFCVDGRDANISRLRELYPSRKAAVVDVETDALLHVGEFDVVFCYGLLYHLSDPLGFIRRAAALCREWLIIETCIMDAEEAIVRLVPEEAANHSQALHSMGCRPSSAYVIYCLKLAGLDNVYVPSTMPKHAQFRYQLNNDCADLKHGERIRDIFVASRLPMDSPHLIKR